MIAYRIFVDGFLQSAAKSKNFRVVAQIKFVTVAKNDAFCSVSAVFFEADNVYIIAERIDNGFYRMDLTETAVADDYLRLR